MPRPRVSTRLPRILASAGAAVRALPGVLGTFGRGLALVAAGSPRVAAGFVTMTLAGSGLPVLQLWLHKRILDGLTGVHGVLGTRSGASGAEPLVAAAAGYALVLATGSGLAPIAQVLARRLQDRAAAEIDGRMMAAGERLCDLYRIERPAFQDEWKVLSFAQYTPLGLFLVFQNGAGTLLTLAGLLCLLARLHPLLPMALAMMGAPYAVGLIRGENAARSTMQQLSRTAREMDYFAQLTTDPVAAKEIRVFGLGPFFLQRFRERFAAASGEMTRVRLRSLGMQFVVGGAYAAAVGVGFWLVAAQAGAGRLTLGDLALYLGAIWQASDRMRLFSQALGIVAQTLGHLRALFAFLDGASPAIALPQPSEGARVPDTLTRGVALDAVGFCYPESAAAVLGRVTAALPAGKVTALVGANGAGKSTLVKLLTRMYDPSSGQILLDGRPLAAYDLASLRRLMSAAYQDFARFALTLRENIAVGAAAGVAAEAGMEHDRLVERAARWAGADTVAAKLPRGYDTRLTRRFEGGVELSGGEWQKVALARAAVRSAAVVILDEPTAALDAEAEHGLLARFRELVAGKTALLISHRLSTVRTADHILVLEDGRIVEQGSHAALVARGGRYAALFEMQAGRYR